MRCDDITLNGRRAFVQRAGEGPPVLCVHTAGQSGLQWRDVLRDLPAHGYEPVVVDLPGHGRSDGAANGPVRDLAAYRDWCLALVAALDLDRFFVVGCSIGGKIALDIAATAPPGLRGVVAMEADAHNTRLSVRQLELSLEDSAAPSRSDRTYYGTLAACGRDVEPDRAAAIAEHHRREDPLVTTGDLIGWASHDLRPRLAAITCPVRLVVGADDFWVDERDAAWTAERITDCRYEVLPGVGHYPMEELPGFPARLAAWLGELADDEPEARR